MQDTKASAKIIAAISASWTIVIIVNFKLSQVALIYALMFVHTYVNGNKPLRSFLQNKMQFCVKKCMQNQYLGGAGQNTQQIFQWVQYYML
jgi:hypothetical protein